jgi:hypothetical protein
MIQWAGALVRGGASFDKLRTRGEGADLGATIARKISHKALKTLNPRPGAGRPRNQRPHPAERPPARPS